MRLIKFKNLKFWRRGQGTAPSHRAIKEGPLPIPHTARVPRFNLLTSYGAVFEQFEHCFYV